MDAAKIKFLYSLLFLLSWVACKKAEPYDISPNYLPPVGKTYTAREMIGFKEIAFNSTTGETGFIKKWQFKEVLIFMVDTSYSYLNNEMDSIIKHINMLTDTNLVYKRTLDRSLANLVVYLTDKNTFSTAEPGAYAAYQTVPGLIGFAYTHLGVNNKIVRASVFLDMTRTNNNTMVDNRYLLRHEVMHTLGFLGHVTLAEFSGSCLSSSYNYSTFFSAFDKRMIPLLYHPAIKAGMNELTVSPIIINL